LYEEHQHSGGVGAGAIAARRGAPVTVIPATAAVIVSLVCLLLTGTRVFGGWRWGLVTAALFVASPLVWEQRAHEPASLFPLAFVTAWLAAIAHFDATRQPWVPAVAGAVLGAGVYSSISAAVMMPLYVLLTAAALFYGWKTSWLQLVALIGGFTAVALPFAIWTLLHPDGFRGVVMGAKLYDATRFNVLQGIREMTSWTGLTARSETYYDYFNPAFLFGGRVFFWPVFVLAAAGLARIFSTATAPVPWLLVGGFLVAPFAASLSAESPAPRRILFITPFVAALSIYGARFLLAWITRFARSPRPADR
jgi:hypothetical protein